MFAISIEETGFDGIARERDEMLFLKVQCLGDAIEVIVHIAAEISRIVGIHRCFQAFFQHCAQGVLAQIVDDAELEIAERANGQGNPLLHQPRNQFFILKGTVAVVDSVNFQKVKRLPYIRWRTFLPRMSDAFEAFGAGAGENTLEFRRRMTDFGAIQPDPNDFVLME